MHPERAEAQIDVTVENRRLRSDGLLLAGRVDWLMGTDARDRVALNAWTEEGVCFATGAMPGAGWFAASDALAGPGPEDRACGGDQGHKPADTAAFSVSVHADDGTDRHAHFISAEREMGGQAGQHHCR